MFRRLFRACLAVVLLLTPVARTSAKPPDLPLGEHTPVGPQVDQAAPSPVAPPEGPVLQYPEVVPLIPTDPLGEVPAPLDPSLPRNAVGALLPAGTVPALPLPEVAPATAPKVRMSEKRRLETCLLVGVHPLLALLPRPQEKCDRGGDRPMTVINGFACPAPVEADFLSDPSGCVRGWLQGLFVTKQPEVMTVEKRALPETPPQDSDDTPDANEESMCLPEDVPPPAPVRKPEVLTVMPHETKDTEVTCPYLKDKAKPRPVVAQQEGMENDVLANLNRLVAAEEMRQAALGFRLDGNDKAAEACYEAIVRLCPGSTLAAEAQQARANLRAAAENPPRKVAVVFVCGAEQLHAQAVQRAEVRAQASAARKRELEIANKLEQPVSLDVTAEPLAKVIERLGSSYSLNIYIDQPALEEEGVVLDKSVSLHVERMPLKTVLTRLLHPAHLTHVVRDEVLQITTERVEDKDVVRVYPVAKLLQGDLPGTGKPHERLVALVQTVQPDSWQSVGGSGTVQYYATSPGLIVRQTPGVHQEIQELLEMLRRRQAEPVVRLESRTYAVADLLMPTGTDETPEVRAARLIAVLRCTVQPKSWLGAGGNGTVEFHPPTMGLVVNQTPEVHERLEELFHALRLLADRRALSPRRSELDAVAVGTRVQMAGLMHAYALAVGQGRFDKAARLASEILALDTSSHALADCTRNLLEKARAVATPQPNQVGPSGCLFEDFGEDLGAPLQKDTCPAEPLPDSTLVWPAVPEYEYPGFEPSTEILESRRLRVTIPWCPPMPPVDFRVPEVFERILEDAPVQCVHTFLQGSDKSPGSNRAEVASTFTDWLDVDGRDGRLRLSLQFSLGGMVFEGKYVDGDVRVKLRAAE